MQTEYLATVVAFKITRIRKWIPLLSKRVNLITFVELSDDSLSISRLTT